MRLKEFFYLLGIRPGVKVYSHRIQLIDLPRDGRVDYARWLAPNVRDLSLQQPDLDELRTFLREGDLAIDVDAQVGDSTLPIALACGGSGAVIAFEPNPPYFRHSRRQCRAQSWPHQHYPDPLRGVRM